MRRRDRVNKKVMIFVVVLVIAISIYYFAFIADGELKQNDEINDIQERNEQIQEEQEETSSSEEGEIYDIAIGKLAPDFTLRDLNGKEVSLSDFRGKYVLINFWYTGCKYCHMEMPDLQRIHDENEDLVVLAVNVMEKREKVENYIKQGAYDFQVLLDEEGDVAITYLVSGFPTSYFVDKEGILIGGVPGMMTYDHMVQILNDIRNMD